MKPLIVRCQWCGFKSRRWRFFQEWAGKFECVSNAMCWRRKGNKRGNAPIRGMKPFGIVG